MRTILALVEGLTEKRFVDEVIRPYLLTCEIVITPTICTTRINPAGSDYKGGTITYERFKKQLNQLLRSSHSYVTMMLDYYALHPTFLLNVQEYRNCFEKVTYIENKLLDDIDHVHRFIPYFQLHEFEGLLFSSPETIAGYFENPESLRIKLAEIRDQFATPEEINDNPKTCPKRRLLNICYPRYDKIFHGPLIAGQIGLETMRSECQHFNEWLTKLENLPELTET